MSRPRTPPGIVRERPTDLRTLLRELVREHRILYGVMLQCLPKSRAKRFCAFEERQIVRAVRERLRRPRK